MDFSKFHGLIPAVVQDYANGDVLMVGFMNEEAYRETRARGEVTFFSRTRNKLWRKGEQSGHVLKVRELLVDCDQDTVLIRADALGPGVCHHIDSRPDGSFLCGRPAVAMVDWAGPKPVCAQHLRRYEALGLKYEPLPSYRDHGKAPPREHVL